MRLRLRQGHPNDNDGRNVADVEYRLQSGEYQGDVSIHCFRYIEARDVMHGGGDVTLMYCVAVSNSATKSRSLPFTIYPFLGLCV